MCLTAPAHVNQKSPKELGISPYSGNQSIVADSLGFARCLKHAGFQHHLFNEQQEQLEIAKCGSCECMRSGIENQGGLDMPANVYVVRPSIFGIGSGRSGDATPKSVVCSGCRKFSSFSPFLSDSRFKVAQDTAILPFQML
jgi:hypothetical protein